MKILVTGGSGFLGSHIVDAITAAGNQAVVFDSKESPWLRSEQTMVVGDVLDADAVKQAMAGCQAVFHLAAIADIGAAISRPRETIEVNVLGTLNMLEAARAENIDRFVFASSIYVYSDQGSFYRTSKQACEHLIDDYRRQFGLAYTILRFGSLYGPRADEGNGVHRLLWQALKEGKIEYHGNGDEVREYIHVRDAAALSVDTLAPEFANQIIHLTGRERMTSRDMLNMINEIMGGRIDLQFNAAPLAGHYVRTPYTYAPKLGRRLTRPTYIDLGLGLLDCLQFLDQNGEGQETKVPSS